jgi:hypothetical protein
VDVFGGKRREKALAPERPYFRGGDDEDGALIAAGCGDMASEFLDQPGLDEDGIIRRFGFHWNRTHAVFHRTARYAFVCDIDGTSVLVTEIRAGVTTPQLLCDLLRIEPKNPG